MVRHRPRWRLAAAAALAAAWIVGGFYYQLDWPLATKAVVLIAAGARAGRAGLASHAGAGGTTAAPRAAPHARAASCDARASR